MPATQRHHREHAARSRWLAISQVQLFMDWPRINQQNASKTTQKDANHKTQFVLSANSYMFLHQSTILRECNEPFVVINWDGIKQSVY